MAAIRQDDLRRDLTVIGGDDYRGREGGSIDELRASVWIAEQLRTIGLEPMGDFGSYFQWWDIRRTRVSALSTVQVGERQFTMWQDIAVSGNAPAMVNAPTVWAGNGLDSTIDVQGKVAIAQLEFRRLPGRVTSVNSAEYRYARAQLTSLGNALTGRGAAAVILIADSTADIAFEGVANIAARGTYRVDDPSAPVAGGRRNRGLPRVVRCSSCGGAKPPHARAGGASRPPSGCIRSRTPIRR
jgi:hypothetical protein